MKKVLNSISQFINRIIFGKDFLEAKKILDENTDCIATPLPFNIQKLNFMYHYMNRFFCQRIK